MKKLKLKTGKDLYYLSRDGRLAIINADYLKTDIIPENYVDLTVTSPPYNTGVEYDSYRDNRPYRDYLDFTYKWLRKTYRLTRVGGRLCLDIPFEIGGSHVGTEEEIMHPLYTDMVSLVKKTGWRYAYTIIWYKGAAPMYRASIGSVGSPRTPLVILNLEAIIVAYKVRWPREGGETDLTRKEYLEWATKIWSFPGESRTKYGHPAPFPLELPLRCIKLFSYIDDIVLDPFLGSGTTLVACKKLRRLGIGVEISMKYCRTARERIEGTPASRQLILTENNTDKQIDKILELIKNIINEKRNKQKTKNL